MDRISECIPNSEDSTKSIGSWSEVGNFSQEFEGVTFFFEVGSPLLVTSRKFGSAELELQRLVPCQEIQPVDQSLQPLSQLLIWRSLRNRATLHQR